MLNIKYGLVAFNKDIDLKSLDFEVRDRRGWRWKLSASKIELKDGSIVEVSAVTILKIKLEDLIKAMKIKSYIGNSFKSDFKLPDYVDFPLQLGDYIALSGDKIEDIKVNELLYDKGVVLNG